MKSFPSELRVIVERREKMKRVARLTILAIAFALGKAASHSLSATTFTINPNTLAPAM